MIGAEFWGGTSVTPLIMLAYLFQALYLLQLPSIFLLERTKWEPVFRGLGAATNVILNIVFIPRLGMSGAAIATVLAYLAMVIAIWFFNRKYYPIKYDWYKIGAIIVLTAAAYLVAIWGDSVIYQVIATGIGLLGIGGILLLPLKGRILPILKKK